MQSAHAQWKLLNSLACCIFLTLLLEKDFNKSDESDSLLQWSCIDNFMAFKSRITCAAAAVPDKEDYIPVSSRSQSWSYLCSEDPYIRKWALFNF